MTKVENTIIYDSNALGNSFTEEFRELILYRDLIAQLVTRNIKTRYKRSVLGVLWTMINPLMMTIVLAMVFSNLYPSRSIFIVYILSGVIAWNFFQQVTTHAMSELMWGGTLLNRIYIPKTVFAASALGTGLINFLLSLIPLLAAMAIYRVPLKPALLFLPVAIVLLAAFAFGVGLLLSHLSLGFADVYEMYQIVLTAWYFMTPILYPMEIISPTKRWLFFFNPMYSLMNIFRAPIIDGTLPSIKMFGMATAVASITLLFGWWSFTRKADQLAFRV
jgi:ABC-type polysaccharide/polyol phosphate export permease